MNLVKSALASVLAVQLMTFPVLTHASVYQPAKTVTPSQVEEALQNTPVPGSDPLAEKEAESRLLASLPNVERSSSDTGLILGITVAVLFPLVLWYVLTRDRAIRRIDRRSEEPSNTEHYTVDIPNQPQAKAQVTQTPDTVTSETLEVEETVTEEPLEETSEVPVEPIGKAALHLAPVQK